jgi:hypothetical protein
MQVIDLTTLPWTHVTRSPDEEWRARAAQWGAPEPIGHDFAAAFLTEARVVTITAQGLRFQLHNREHHFWQEDTLTLQPNHIGQQRTIRYDADDLSCVHVFERTGATIRYIETINRYEAPHMLDAAACGKVLAASQRQQRRVLAELEELKRPEILAETRRVLTNAEKIQHVRTFPIPAGNRHAEAQRAQADPSRHSLAQADTFSASPKSNIDAGPAGNGTPIESDTQGVDRSPLSDSVAESSRRSPTGEGGLSPDAPPHSGAAASRHTVPPVHCCPVLRTDDSLLGESPRLSDGRSLQADRQSPFASAEEASRRSPTGAGGPIASQLVTATNRARRQHVTDLTEADARRARERARIRRLATVLEDY